MEIKNAKIKSTMLGRENHGIMTFMIYASTEDFSFGIGGYGLDYYNPDKKIREFNVKGLEAISKILETVGVDRWEELPGKYIRIEDNGPGTIVSTIGNIIDDKWVNFNGLFSRDAE